MAVHVQRYLKNRAKVPIEYFSMLNEIYMNRVAVLGDNGVILPDKMMPDISTGRMFSDFLRQKGINPDSLPYYEHEFTDGSGKPTVRARLYPIELSWPTSVNTSTRSGFQRRPRITSEGGSPRICRSCLGLRRCHPHGSPDWHNGSITVLEQGPSRLTALGVKAQPRLGQHPMKCNELVPKHNEQDACVGEGRHWLSGDVARLPAPARPWSRKPAGPRRHRPARAPLPGAGPEGIVPRGTKRADH